MGALGAVGDEAQTLVEPARAGIRLLHVQAHAAAQRCGVLLALADQRGADAAAAQRRKHADVDEQMLGRHALQVIAADRSAFGMLDHEEIGVAEMIQIVLVLQPELLIEKTPLGDLGPRYRRHFLCAGAGVEIPQPGQIVVVRCAQRKPALCEERGRLHAVCMFRRERCKPRWCRGCQVTGTTGRCPAARYRSSRRDTAVGSGEAARRPGWG